MLGCAPWTRGSEHDSPASVFPQATNLTQLLNLAESMQNTLLPVHLEGVVCWLDPGRGHLVALQADSRVAFLQLDLPSGSVSPGDTLVIDGNCLVQFGKFDLRQPPLVDNDGLHGRLEKTGTVFLRAGKCPFEVLWFDKGGECALELDYQGPNLPRQGVPANALFRALPDPVGGATNWAPGLEYRAYEGTWDALPDFSQLTPVRQGTLAGLDVEVRTRTNHVGLVFAGFLDVPRDGLYTFFLRSDDGSRLRLAQPPTRVTVKATHQLPPPRHVIPGQPFQTEERQWSEVEGTATFVQERTYGYALELSSAQGWLTAVLPDVARFSPSLLLAGRLRLRGVCQGIYSIDGESIAGRLLVSGPEVVEVLSVPPSRWDDYPLSAIPGKLPAPTPEGAEVLAHLRGRIRSVTTDRVFTLEDAVGSVLVETLQPLTAKASTAVEVLGRWRQTPTNLSLVSALWRQTLTGTEPGAEEPPRLTTIEQVHNLKRDEAQREHPVHIRGVVTYVRLGTADGVLQDSTRGVYVRDLAPQGFVGLDEGDYLEVEGETQPGDFAPVLHARRVTPLGRGQMPSPMRPTWDQLMSGSADCQYVEIEGIFTASKANPLRLLLREGPLQVIVEDYDLPELARLENAHVRLRGCLLAKWDPDTRRVIPGTIQLRRVSAHVQEPVPLDLFARPSKQIAELQQFDAHAGALERVWVSAQVLQHRAGIYYLTDGTNGLRCLLATPGDLTVGQRVDVAGFPELGGHSPLLREAVVRKLGRADPPPPRRLEPETLLSGNLDALLVEVEGRLVGSRLVLTEHLLEIQSGARTFLARLATNSGPVEPGPIGSQLRLRGVYAAHGGNRATGQDTDSFELLLNQPGDVQILARPSWWTPRRTLTALAGLAGVLLLAASWILALRRQVDRRTEQLRQEIEERKRTETTLSAEIQERKRMERQVEQTYQQLLIVSREAGMAEVATNVLHNVGNVLNSANVSTDLLLQKAKQSKVAGLAKVAELIRSHERDFPEFVLRDPRGQKLPHYLVQLAEHLGSEQARTLDELRSLAANVEHIMEIVAMQQNYARISGVSERVPAKALMEDALRMSQPSLEGDYIQLQRDYQEPLPEIQVDRYKVLQILLNLLDNARNACVESDHKAKAMTVRLSCQEQRVRFSVADNGVGIATENLTRIFQHGFTTRQRGHGFGLHSGALAAKELGGALAAFSDGPGKGATFTLELPLTTCSQ